MCVREGQGDISSLSSINTRCTRAGPSKSILVHFCIHNDLKLLYTMKGIRGLYFSAIMAIKKHGDFCLQGKKEKQCFQVLWIRNSCSHTGGFGVYLASNYCAFIKRLCNKNQEYWFGFSISTSLFIPPLGLNLSSRLISLSFVATRHMGGSEEQRRISAILE